MNFRKLVVQAFRLLGRSDCFFRPETILFVAIHEETGVGHAGVGQSETRVFLDRVVEQSNRCLNVFRILLTAERSAAAKIEIIRGDVLGWMGGASAVRRFSLQNFREFSVDLVFKCEEIAGHTGKFLAPLQAIVDHVFEVDDDAKLVASTLHKSVDDVIDTQILCDAGQRRFLIVCFGCGRSGGDANVGKLKKFCRERLVETIGNIVQRIIGAQYAERQNGDEFSL